MSTSHRDYIPQNATQFNVFLQKILQYVGEHDWEKIPQESRQALTSVTVAYDAAFHAALEAPTPANILRRKEAQVAATKEVRSLVNEYLRFPPVTNADRLEMGIPNHDTIRTDHTVVTEIVDFVIHVRTAREVQVDFWIQGADHKAKPHGYDGAVLVWDVLDAPPKNADDLHHHTMASRTPYALHFDETERGKTVYVALVWQNERGIVGHWSDIKSAIVP